jgi:hypothetical protein
MSDILSKSIRPPRLKRMDWVAYQACLEGRLPCNPKVNDEEAIYKFVEELSNAIQEALAASAPRRRPRADPQPSLPVGIQNEIRLKNRWQVTRDPTLKSRVRRLQRSITHRLNEWRNKQWSDALESLDSADQLLWKLTRRVIRFPTPSPPLLVPGGRALSDSEKADALPTALSLNYNR